MLNPRWEVNFKEEDIKKWEQLLSTAPVSYPFQYKILDYLLNKYFVTQKGYRLSPNHNVYEKFEILKKTMGDLEKALENKAFEDEISWREKQEEEESLDARLQREEDLYEREASMSFDRISSRVDYPHNDLPEEFWDKKRGKYVLKNKIANAIEKKVSKVLKDSFNNPDQWIQTLLLGSSITTQFWKEDSDIDVKIVIDPVNFKIYNSKYAALNEEDLKKHILGVLDKYKGKASFAYGPHPFDFYPVFKDNIGDDDFIRHFDSLYDIRTKMWIKPPSLLDINTYDRDEAIKEGEEMALEWAEKWDTEIGTIKRKAKEAELVDGFVKTLDKDQRGRFKEKLERLLDSLKTDINQLRQEKQEVKEEYHDAYNSYSDDLVSYYGSINALPEVIRIKLLNLWGYLYLIKSLGKIVEFKRDLDSEDLSDINQVISPREETFKGGLADNVPDEKFDPKELKMGIEIELEHTNDKVTAKEIAKDHLMENPKYYTLLKKFESQFEKSASISIRDIVKADAADDFVNYWKKAKNKDFDKYWNQVKKKPKKKKKKKASLRISNSKGDHETYVPNPIRKNEDYGTEWQARVISQRDEEEKEE